MRLELISRIPADPPRGPPLLFVHGALHAAWCWDVHFLEYFARRGLAAHAVSLRGHGASEGVERRRWWRIRHYVADLAAVAEQLPARPVLVGHSMGGLVVQKYLERHAAPGAVLLSSVPPNGLLTPLLRVARRHPGVVARINLELSLEPLLRDAQLLRELFFSQSLSPERIQTYLSRLQADSYVSFLEMVGLCRVNVRRIRTPILVLGAQHDAFFDRRDIVATAHAYRAPLSILPGVAHDSMLEAGWQLVADRILAWVAERSTEAEQRETVGSDSPG